MNQKEEIKEEKKRINEALKIGFNNYDGVWSEIQIGSIALPKLRLTNQQAA